LAPCFSLQRQTARPAQEAVKTTTGRTSDARFVETRCAQSRKKQAMVAIRHGFVFSVTRRTAAVRKPVTENTESSSHTVTQSAEHWIRRCEADTVRRGGTANSVAVSRHLGGA
ncbi:hypothetical protein Z043_126104, partial [Scleropages formosus]